MKIFYVGSISNVTLKLTNGECKKISYGDSIEISEKDWESMKGTGNFSGELPTTVNTAKKAGLTPDPAGKGISGQSSENKPTNRKTERNNGKIKQVKRRKL